eukprot:gb/GEZJ01006469.1/.p1 GENE.gb/GEZJ01006469.1/~~gb/GEZJ01006469.1/.p1  ORF type:complete len:171 (-),score=11.55 gb/GEZJ01006469.1/:564-1076(-)
MSERNLRAVIKESERSSLPSQATKVSWPAEGGSTEVLGIEVGKNGILMPKREKMRTLITITENMLKKKIWKVQEVQSIIGKWAWFMLLRRPLFSVFERIYSITSSTKEYVGGNVVSRKELELILKLAPLIWINISTPFNTTIICTDASLIGGGVVYTECRDPLKICKGSD